MVLISSSLLNWIFPAFSSSASLNVLLGIVLWYFLIVTASVLYRHAHNTYLYYKIPGLPYRRYIAYIVGNAEVYLFDLFYLKRTLILRQMFEICMYIPEFYEVGVVRFSVAFQKFIILFRPDVVEELFNSMSNIEKARQYEFFSSWLGLGLLTSAGEKWKRHRKLLTPAFHFKILESFVPVMNESSTVMLELFERQLNEDAQSQSVSSQAECQASGETLEKKSHAQSTRSAGIDIRTYIGNCTLDTICETAMGIKIGAQSAQSDQSAYIAPVNRVLINTVFRGMEPLLHNDIIFALSPRGRQTAADLKIIHEFVMNVIEERIDAVKKHLADNNIQLDQLGAVDEIESFSRKRYAFLDLLIMTHLKFGEHFTLKDILDEVQTFMFEGHDTTSSGLTFALLLIAGDHRVQDKIYEEFESIFDGDMRRTITMEDCRQMRYLDLVIKECLRLYPPVPFIARKITKQFTVKGFVLPEGCTCMVPIYLLHRDPDTFPNPEHFLPERFESDAMNRSNPYSYVPFSAGARNCIGQKFAMLEMKVVLTSILRKYRLTSLVQRDEVDTVMSVVTKADSPISIQFDRRQPLTDSCQ